MINLLSIFLFFCCFCCGFRFIVLYEHLPTQQKISHVRFSFSTVGIFHLNHIVTDRCIDQIKIYFSINEYCICIYYVHICTIHICVVWYCCGVYLQIDYPRLEELIMWSPISLWLLRPGGQAAS